MLYYCVTKVTLVLLTQLIVCHIYALTVLVDTISAPDYAIMGGCL